LKFFILADWWSAPALDKIEQYVVGRSSFCNVLMGTDTVKVGTQQDSQTQSFDAAVLIAEGKDEPAVILIDTPGTQAINGKKARVWKAFKTWRKRVGFAFSEEVAKDLKGLEKRQRRKSITAMHSVLVDFAKSYGREAFKAEADKLALTWFNESAILLHQLRSTSLGLVTSRAGEPCVFCSAVTPSYHRTLTPSYPYTLTTSHRHTLHTLPTVKATIEPTASPLPSPLLRPLFRPLPSPVASTLPNPLPAHCQPTASPLPAHCHPTVEITAFQLLSPLPPHS